MKLERNPYIQFRRRLRTDGRTNGQTTDNFQFNQLCCHSQAELKVRKKKYFFFQKLKNSKRMAQEMQQLKFDFISSADIIK